MVGTSYSFFFKNLIEECRNTLTPMLKQKKCSGGGQWWRENNRNVEMQKGRKENEERSFLMAERDSLPSCSLNMHDLCAKNQ